jgi:hypothetical protein
MSANRSPNHRFRIILDCALVLLVILIAGANYLSGQARSEAGSAAGEALVSAASPLSDADLATAQPVPALPALDNNTLAAMIAAENAALTPPILFTDLPLVIR